MSREKGNKLCSRQSWEKRKGEPWAFEVGMAERAGEAVVTPTPLKGPGGQHWTLFDRQTRGQRRARLGAHSRADW